MKLDALNRPIPENHPLRPLGDYTEKNDERAANDPVVRKGRLRIKKRLDALNATREMQAIDARMKAWDSL